MKAKKILKIALRIARELVVMAARKGLAMNRSKKKESPRRKVDHDGY